MFRIRRIYDDLLPVDRNAIAQVQDILREQFPLLSRDKVNKLPDQLRNPFKYRFRSILFVAEGIKGGMIGSLRLPTLVVQEGGYRIRTLGTNARHFFIGLWEGMHRFSDPVRMEIDKNDTPERENRGSRHRSGNQVPGLPSPF